MPPINVTNVDLLRPILRKERRIEMALEEIRYWDLLRWGILGDVMQGDFWGASFPCTVLINKLTYLLTISTGICITSLATLYFCKVR